MTITQPTATSNTSAGATANSATCFSADELRAYLSGWSDDARAAAIETHLLACSNCERTLQELENTPDTLWQSLQGTTVARSVSDRDPSNARSVSNAATDIARSEIDAMREGSRPETGRATETDQATEAALEKVRQLMDVPVETAADKDKAAWQPATRELGVYELLKPLGRGGMGAVYLANHRQLKKQVAIKLLPIMSAEDSDVRARFQREIRVVGRLNHPSIVTATDAGEIDGTQFLVMEYVPGLDLSRLARLLGKLPVADACELIRQVALGLSCAHAEGVVHRDVKPSNLMLDEAGRIRILDFGLAQLSFWDEASVDLTTVGQLMGTLDYMAPEQAEFGGNVDYRADLYALGATLFRFLCGRPPLAAAPNQSPLEKLRLLANHQPPKLNTLCPEAPPELVALVGSLLSRSPQDRPASAAHAAEQLAAFTADADLVGLLRNAKEKAAASPELLNTEKPGWPQKPGFLEKPAFYPPSPTAESNGSRRGKKFRNWLLAATLPLLLIAGIFIKLETDKGQLVIESDIDNIKVQIVSNGKPVSGLTINHGTTATRLRADKYEVTIDGPSDGLTIENEQFTLKNGETVVAKIRYAMTAPLATTNAVGKSPYASSATVGEPVYEGKTFQQWLELAEYERSPERFGEALVALMAMTGPETAERVTAFLLEKLPQVDGSTVVTLANSGQIEVDNQAFQILTRANPRKAYFQLMAEQFEHPRRQWRDRLKYWCGDLDLADNVEPLLSWAEQTLASTENATDADSYRGDEAADILCFFLATYEADKKLAARIRKALESSEALHKSWWVSGTTTKRFVSTAFDANYPCPIAIRPIVVSRAVDVLEDMSVKGSPVAQAAMVISDGIRFLDSDQQMRVLSALGKRLEQAAENKETLPEMVEVPEIFEELAAPIVSDRFWLRRNNEHGHPKTCIVLEMLDLVDRLDGEESIAQSLKKLEASLARIAIIDRQLPGSAGKPIFGGQLFLNWPECFPQKEQNSGMPSKFLLGDERISPEDWRRILIYNHPAMLRLREPTKDSSETTSSPTMTHQPETAAATEPLYEGKTLSEWLDMLSRERSPTGLKSALDACAALVSPETSERITQTILKTVRGLDGTTNLTPGQVDGRSLLDRAAENVLLKANPGAAFYELWVKEFDAADEKWRERLWSYLYQSEIDEKLLEPFVVWAERRLKNGPTGNPSEDEVTLKAASYLRDIALAFSRNHARQAVAADDSAFDKRVLTALKSCPLLDIAWWLSRPLVYRNSSTGGRTYTDQNIWPAGIKSEITRVAIEALENDASTPVLAAQACMILANGANLDAGARSQVLTAVNRRLTALCANPETLRARVLTDGEFASFLAPNINAPFGPQKSIFQFSDSTTAYLALLYLDVMKSLDDRPGVSQGLSDVLSQVQPSRDLLTTAREKSKSDGGRNTGNSSFGPGSGLQLTWPDLTIVESGQSFGFNAARSVESMVVRTIWGIPDPTFTNWFDYCILQHPVMQDYLVSIEKPADDAQPAEVEKPAPMSRTQKRPTSPATEPVFDGKTLSQWLSVIQTERSPEAFLAAMNACSALTTPKTSEQISATLLEVLPTWHGDVRVKAGDDSFTTIDREAFGLLAHANAGRKYYELLAKQYGSPDAEWRKRLAPQLRIRVPEKFENVEPLLSWAERTVQDSNTTTIAPQDLNDAASFLTTFIGKFPDNKAFVDSAVAALTDCKALQPEWWMARLVAFRDVDRKYIIRNTPRFWPAALNAAVASRAITALEDPMAAENLVAQALMILSNIEDLTPDQTTKILTAVNQRLIKAAQSPELLVHMIDVDPSFEILTVPHQQPATEDGVNSHSPKQISWGFSTTYANAKASITLELLDLFQTLQAESPTRDGLEAIAAALADVESLDFESFTYSGSWPGLAAGEQQIVRSRSNSPPKKSLATQPPSEILKIVLHEHPALVEYRNSLKTDEKAEEPQTPQP